MASDMPSQLPRSEHVFFTLDDDEKTVLELVKSDDTGIYIRHNSTWTKIDPDAENDRVWDRVIADVQPGVENRFDTLVEKHRTVEIDQIQEFVIPEGDEQ